MSVVAAVVAWVLVAGQAEVTHLDASLSVDGAILSTASSDVDGLPGNELSVAVYERASGRRELRVYRVGGPAGREAEPFLSVPIKSDVLSWCWAELLPAAGRELVLLTRSGAWALPQGAGLREVRRLAEVELFFDVPDPTTLPRWPWVVARDGGDGLLLPEPDGYGLWLPSGADGLLRRDAWFPSEEARSDSTPRGRRGRGRVTVTAGEIRIAGHLRGGLAGEQATDSDGAHLLSASSRLDAPALCDVDGDGELDLLRWDEGALALHLGRDGAIPVEPSRRDTRVASVDADGSDLDALLHDLDGDGDLDVLGRLRSEREGNLDANRSFSLLVLINDGTTLLPEVPRQLLKFEAAELQQDVADVDGDGLPDLVIAKVLAPDLTALASPDGIQVTRSVLIFRGLGEGRFSRRPDVEREDVYDAASLGAAISTRDLSLDFSGDGLADLIDVDLRGSAVVHRLQRKSSLFGADAWTLERAPWRRLAGVADMDVLRVTDVNGDGLGDVLSHAGERLTLLLSQRAGAGR